MAEKKKKKSIADSIINGTYNPQDIFSNDNTKKKSIADSIIGGTYNSEDFFPSKKKATTTDIAPVKKETSVWSNILTNTKAIGSNLLKSAESGLLQFNKTFQMRNDETINSRNKLFSETTGKLLVEQAKKKGSSEEELNKIKEKYGYKEIDTTKRYQTRIEELNKEMAENVEKTTNPVAKKVSELSQSMGNTLVGMGVSALNPLAGLTYFTGSATGSYYDEGLRRGMTKEEAKNYGAILGGIEGTLDKYLAVSNIKGVKSILEGAGAKNVLKAFGLEIGENFVQEAVMPSLSEVTALTTAGKEHLKYDFNTADGWKDLLADSWSDGVDGALSAILLGGTTRGVSSAINVTNKLKNGEQVSQTEIAEAVKDTQEAGINTEEILKTELVQTAEKKLMQEEQQPVQQELFEQPNAQQFTEQTEQLDTELNSTLETKEVVQPKQEAENIINKTKENISKNPNNNLIEMVSIEDINTIDKTGGGFRTEAEISQLREDIKNNGITQPIEVIKDENGNITLNDGNHRLQIAKELGLKEIPVIAYTDGNFTNYTNIKNNTTQTKATQEFDAPVNQNIVEQQNQEAFKNITDNDIPMQKENTTPAEMEQVQVDDPFKNRDIDEVGNRKAKSYQYENPEVRPYFQEEAQNMLHDLDNTVKGQKGMTQDELGNTEFYGTTRQTAEAIAYLKDNYGYSYDQIRKGLNDIIEGKDNNAVAKRIEFMLDERLREGYTTSDGVSIPANQDYINFLNEKQATEYNREASNTLSDKDVPTEALKEDLSREVKEQVKDIKSELKTLKTQLKELQAPIKEVVQELKANIPTQQEIDNLFDTQKNKSGSEYARAFYDLQKKYGATNLYKALNEENSRAKKGTKAPVQENIISEATEQEIAPSETAQSPFELTDEQNAKIQELRDDTKKWAEIYKERYDDKKFAAKRIKGVAMQNAAEIRNTTQGDWLIPIEGGLTDKELSTLTNRLRSNYIGKPVLIDGKEGTITGNAYGKIGVEFTDGTKQYVDKNSIQPVEDIDSIIQEQQRMYDEYKQEVAPEPQKQAIEELKTEVKEIAPIKEKVAQNGNTKQPEIKKETQVEEKVAQILSETPTQENRKQRLWAKFRAGILDKGSVFEDLSIRNKNRELMSKWDYMQTAESRAQSVMMNGTREFDSETKTETQVSKSLNDIQAEVGDKVQEFSEYLYHKHNISRMSLEANAQAKMQELQTTTLAEYDIEAIEKLSRKRITEKTSEEATKLIETAKEYVKLSDVKNKPVFGDSITADVSKQVVNEFEMNNPEFMDWAKDVYDYNNANLNQLVKSGVISQETADQFAEIYPNYVPIGRANKNGNAINVPLDTNRTTINTPIKGAKGGNSDILPLFDTLAKRTIQTYRATAKNNFGVELKNTLKSNAINQTTNVDEVLENVDQQESLLQEGKDGKAPTFTVFENGEKVTYDITQDMYEALKPVNDSSILSTTFKPFNKISNFHRGVLTEYNPVFMLTNSIKDAQDVLMNSQHPAKTYAKFGESYAQIVKKGYWYQEYMANGGEQNSYFDSQEGTFNTERKGIEKVLDTFPLKQISQLNNVIEMAPRLAEYIASRESGRSVETSMLDAARVTTNFKAGGDITKWANRNGATFLNASIQGAMQQVRNVREANANGLKGYANLALKFTMAGVPALLLNGLLWSDDDEYEELSDYVKQNYYIVGKYGDGNFIRIPKGRMVSVIQESFNQMKHLITGDGEADLGQFLEIMGTNIAPNNPIQNNVLSPIIQAATNTTWYGDDLVPTRLQDEPVKEQFDESTDKLSIFLGQKLGISPYKINYVLDQYSGGIGDVFLPMMTQQAETGTDNVVSELIAPLTSKFTVDSVMKNQNVSDLYTKSEELTSKANSTSATDEDILKNKYLNSIKSEMNVLYKEKREIQSSNLSDSEKYNQVREIQEQINNMAKNAMDSYENVNKTSNYATIGNKEYYLKNDTWTKVDKEELEELNSLDMDMKAKSTYFDLKSEISEIKDSKAENKKSQIATAVKNTGLTDMQKAYVYGKNYSSDETLDLVINTGISFNEYLDFASQEFESDYNYKGNAINGSRKKKVYDYLNSMNIDYEQKLILAKMEYPSEDRYNYEIIEYLNNNNSIDYATMESILLELGFKVDSQGNINW